MSDSKESTSDLLHTLGRVCLELSDRLEKQELAEVVFPPAEYKWKNHLGQEMPMKDEMDYTKFNGVGEQPTTGDVPLGYGRQVFEFNEAMGELYPDVEVFLQQDRFEDFVDMFALKYKLIDSERSEFMKHYIEIMNNFLLPIVHKQKASEVSDEVVEFNRESYRKYMIMIVDDLADIIYTCVHMALCLNIDIDRIFHEVHANNMTKMGPDGQVIKADGTDKFLDPSSGDPLPAGKVVKPDNYKPVDLSPFVK